MQTKRKLRLYNIFFPIWLLWIFPITWLFILPANFLIDLLVIFLTLKHLNIPDKGAIIRQTVFKVWIIGFLSDMIGSAAMFPAAFTEFPGQTAFAQWWADYLSYPIGYNPFSSIPAFLWVTVCVLISGYFIYLLNLKISFKRVDCSDVVKKKLALSLAVFTAPYVFYLPTAWFI